MSDPRSWNFANGSHASEVVTADCTMDSVGGRRTTAPCVQTVPIPYRAKVTAHASVIHNVIKPGLRPPLPCSAHHHETPSANNHHQANNLNATNNVPSKPCNLDSLNAQNFKPSQNPSEINVFNVHGNNVPNWNRSVDILTALNSAIPRNSISHEEDFSAKRPANTVRPVLEVFAVPGEIRKDSIPVLYHRNLEEAKASCACVPISIPRVSSWSFTKKTTASTPTAFVNPNDFRNSAENSMIKIHSADNIRRLHFVNASSNIATTSNMAPFSDRPHHLPNNNENSEINAVHVSSSDAICCQPRESKNVAQNGPMLVPMLVNKGAMLPNPAKNSVVHWTNSVENRVCCPENVLYGAVYGLKCLK